MSSRRYPGSKKRSSPQGGPSSPKGGFLAPLAPAVAPLVRPYPGLPPRLPGARPFPNRIPPVPRPPGTPGFKYPIPEKLPFGWAGRFAGRALPVIGTLLLAKDLYDLWFGQKPGNGYAWSSDWITLCSISDGGPGYQVFRNNLPANNPPNALCGVPLQVPDSAPLEDLITNAANNGTGRPFGVTVYMGPLTTGGLRYTIERTMFLPRYTFTPADLPQYQRGFTYPLDDTPPFYWTADPLAVPPLVPMPFPVPVPVPLLPHTRPNPDRVPGERPDDGPVPKPDPWVDPKPIPVDPVWPYPVDPVYPGTDAPGRPVVPSIPSVDTGGVIGGGTNNPVTTQPGGHEPRPPKQNEREKKGKIPGAQFAALHGALSLVTEGADLVNAIYKALPLRERRFKGRDGKWRDKDLGPLNKAKRIWDNIDKIDVDEAVKNVIQNQIEDAIIGGLSSGARKGLARKGWSGKTNPFGTPSTLPDLPSIGPATPL